jgi:AcrR family transcriptional regulator
VGEPESRPSRAERRQRTATRILGAARELFAQVGYERTTIRAVAARADVDPALVMQHFGSKDELFRRAVSLVPDETLAGEPEQLLEHLLTTIGLKLGDLPQTSIPVLRSAFTHPEAADHVRRVQADHVQRIAAALPAKNAKDAELRAALIVAVMMGVTIQRHLIHLAPLRDASDDQVVEFLRPGIESLIGARTKR